MFKKILIANRGEIAVRIIRTCRELGIKTCLVYSEADKESLPVKLADEAICIGKSHPKESYLLLSRILSAVEISGSDALHPGYGFLAENADLVEACQEMKITFIGPPPQFLRLFADKLAAKKKMAEIGIPVIPGSDVLKDEEEAKAKAKEIGYPVILKACAGGGGKGMKIVREEKEMASSFQRATAEANSAFEDPRIYLEKLFTQFRHIEVQILADNYGNCLFFPERNCTIQKNFQKVIEETPSPGIKNEDRDLLQRLVKSLVVKTGYQNVGTMEFLEVDGNFYFMEINTRIQVEHPISEEASGVDIIKNQILISAGERFEEKTYEPLFWSMEARVTGKNQGKINLLLLPGGPFVRIDTHIYQGYNFSTIYDQLLLKLIVRGKDREETRRRMVRALSELKVEGIETNQEELVKILESERFRQGDYKIDYYDSQPLF
ncbi:MAG: biotin carboxylase N-terminal domain-containing protein [candidate division WOR-3 bacterium]